MSSHSLRFCFRLICSGWLFLIITISFSHAQSSRYYDVTGPCNFKFPQDHGAHPGYRIEWWYYTGNLASNTGEHFGFQLTFFRTQISPPGSDKTWPKKSSAWRTQQVFLAHAAVSNLNRQKFRYDQRMARGAVGLAGTKLQGSVIQVFLGKWRAQLDPEGHRLLASSEHFAFDLACIPAKTPVAHGVEGYSRKGSRPGDASCYYSITRLNVSGTLVFEGKRFGVEGRAWMDHEFSTAPLDIDILGWDWFSVQLSDDTELMIYLLRLRQGGYLSESSGTFVLASGQSLHLEKMDFSLQILDHWKSPHTGAVYPSRWAIQVYPVELDLSISSNLEDQEVVTGKTTQIIYWEGSVSASGKARGQDIDGVGYVEMTGYARPFGLLR